MSVRTKPIKRVGKFASNLREIGVSSKNESPPTKNPEPQAAIGGGGDSGASVSKAECAKVGSVSGGTEKYTIFYRFGGLVEEHRG